MKKKKFVLVLSVVIIVVLTAILYTRAQVFPDADKIEYVKIHNRLTQKNVILSKEDSKKLYNSVKIKKISNRERIKMVFSNEITFYDMYDKALTTLYVEPFNNSVVNQVAVKQIIGRGLYSIDKQFYDVLVEVRDKYNFCFREHLEPDKWESNLKP